MLTVLLLIAFVTLTSLFFLFGHRGLGIGAGVVGLLWAILRILGLLGLF